MSAFLRASGTFMRADSQTDRAKFARHRGLKSSCADVAWRASSQKKPSANPDRVLMPTCASGELQEISGRAVVSAAASNFSRGGIGQDTESRVASLLGWKFTIRANASRL